MAHVQKRIEIANYEKSIQAAFAEVADGLAGKRTLDEQIRAEQLLVAASQKAYELAEQRFQEGVDDNLTVPTRSARITARSRPWCARA